MSDWIDRPLPEDASIEAALKGGKHRIFEEAIRLVEARRSKKTLVELVNWLLTRIDGQQSDTIAATAKLLDCGARLTQLQAKLEAAEKSADEHAIELERELAEECAKREAAEEQTALMAGSHASMVTSKTAALKLGVEYKERAEAAERLLHEERTAHEATRAKLEAANQRAAKEEERANNLAMFAKFE